MKLAVFGGTFDPPHYGHILIAEKVISAKLAEKVIFVPAYDPPHKTGRKISPFEQRMEMLKLTLAGKKHFIISETEKTRAEIPSYTLSTMNALAAEYPGDELYILIGSDSLRQLHTWHNAEELIEKWNFIVYPRKGEQPSVEELEKYWTAETARRLMSFVISMPFIEISSTEIRNAMAKKENVSNLSIPELMDYIRKNRLYQDYNNGVLPMSSENEEKKKAVKKLNAAELAALCMEIAEDRKAENIIQLKLTELSSLADYFILCTGNSEPHISAIAERIARGVREQTGKHARSVEGTPASKWMVIDLGDVIVHVLSPEMRELYQLESLWGDAPRTDAVKKLKKASSPKEK